MTVSSIVDGDSTATVIVTPQNNALATGTETDTNQTESNGKPLQQDEKTAVVSKQPSVPYQPTFPEGGTRAWLVVAGAAGVNFVSFGYVNSFGVFNTYYKEHFLSDYSESSIAWIGSVQLALLYMGGLLSGRLSDTYGARWPILVGSVLLLLANLTLAEAREYYQIFLAHGVCFGLGNGFIFYPAVSSVSHWFAKKRGLALSVAVAGSSLGGIVWPILMNHLIHDKNLGFASVSLFALCSLIDLPILIFINCFVRGRLGKRTPGPLIEFSFFKDARFVFLVLGAFLNFWGNFVPFFFIESFAIGHGLTLNQAFYIVAILNASSMCGRLITGRLADKFGPFNCAIPSVFLSGVFCFSGMGVTNPGGVYVFTVLFGMTSGSFVAIANACCAKVCKDLRKLGSMSGLLGVFNGLAGLTGAPIGGAIIARQGGTFRGAWGFAATSMLLGSIALVQAKLIFKKPFFSKI